MIKVTYLVHSAKEIDPEKKARGIALGQTTDTWTPTARSGQKKLRKHTGSVLDCQVLPNDAGGFAYRLLIGYPEANTENDIPSLLTMIFGKISLDGEIRLEEIEFSPEFMRGKGPRFGIDGIRKRVAESDRPLTMAIFKPCVGLTPKELGAMFEQLALGGMHLVKDDEILPDLAICPTEKRLEACLEAARRVRKATGRETLYAVNLTGPATPMIQKAKRLARQGARCFLLNVLSYGYGIMEELRDVGVPIMAHPALAGAIGGSSSTGISYRVILGSLMRLGGADIVLFPSSYGTVALPASETKAITEALRQVQRIRRSFPGPSAGIHPGLVPRILQDYGNDVIINAGGGVHGHPQGAQAGARAFLQAVDFALQKRDFQMLSGAQAPELAEALRLWGAPR